MRFERMVIEAGSNTFSLVAHPRLTVVAGVGQTERDALTGELLGALGSARPGVHVELVQDDGRRIAVFRPHSGESRVVDVDEATDVSDEYRTSDGRLDLLAKEGLDLGRARRRLRLNRSDLAASAQGDELVRRLAQLEQTELWSAAARVRVTDDELTKEAEAAGSAPEDAELIEAVEQRHLKYLAAIDTSAKLRKYSTLVGVLLFVAGLAAGVLVGLSVGALLMVLAVVTFVVAMTYQRRVDAAEAEEQTALNAAGAESYLGFHLQRVNGMLTDDTGRKRLARAAEDHREAAARWAHLAGDVSVDWALERHDEIAAAAQLRKKMTGEAGAAGAGGAPAGGAASSDEAADLAHALVGKLSRARTAGQSGEGFPLILDDPFVGLPDRTKAALLDLLNRASGEPQVIFLTGDDEVAAWAREEALSGSLAVLEPKPQAETSAAADADLAV